MKMYSDTYFNLATEAVERFDALEMIHPLERAVYLDLGRRTGKTTAAIRLNSHFLSLGYNVIVVTANENLARYIATGAMHSFSRGEVLNPIHRKSCVGRRRFMNKTFYESIDTDRETLVIFDEVVAKVEPYADVLIWLRRHSKQVTTITLGMH